MTPEPSELQELVRALHQQAAPWLPAGLASRLDWGPPVAGAAQGAGSQVLSCRKLNQILAHNPDDFTVRVQAGTPLVELQEALAHHRQWLAVDPPWGGGSPGNPHHQGSIGGLVARGLAGGLRQRYLGIRDQVIGISLLRADGTAAKAGGQVVKNVAGYDLMRLLTGSWGSLALITELSLRTLPIPPQRLGIRVSGDLDPLAALGRWLLQSSLSPERLDWWRQGSSPWSLVISLASINRQTLSEQSACIQAKAAEIAKATGLALETEQLEPEALAALEAEGRGQSHSPSERPGEATSWLLRVGVQASQVPALLAGPELEGMAVVLAAGSGLGLAWAPAAALPIYRAEALRRRCQVLGGYLTVLQQPAGSAMAAWLDAPSRPMIEAIKRQFDPKQQLARGRLPGVQPTPVL